MRAQLRFLLLFLIVWLGSAPAAAGQSCFDQAFPTGGPEETRWRICWQAQAKHGLVITSAHFRKSPSSAFIRVFWDARVSEIFVPYHSGSPRYYDVGNFSFSLVTLNAKHCPAAVGGVLLGSPSKVCREVRDRGLAWADDSLVRRGQEVVLWGALDAGNYNYIQEWTFRDDGVVMGRVGATGVNLPSKPLEAHIHNPIWRLDIDLNGASGDSVHLGTHTENLPGTTATDSAPLIAAEGGRVWNPEAFTSLHIHDAALRNANGKPSAYHLMPWRFGSARHQEAFTKQDFWVSRYSGSEMLAKNILSYVSPAQAVTNSDIVVWYMGSVHHLVRDEDGRTVGSFGWEGEAHVMWTGFLLKPHNIFERTPLFP